MNAEIGKSLISELEIQYRTAQLAKQIADDFRKDDLIIIAVLKGAFMFTADLIRRLSKYGVHHELDFIKASSYGNSTESSGKIKIETDVQMDLRNANVLLVDDIIDTGNTLSYIRDYLYRKNAKTVKTCVLLDKPSRRTVNFQPDYIGFEIPDHFVVGYGLDYAEMYRCLPYIAELKN